MQRLRNRDQNPRSAFAATLVIVPASPLCPEAGTGRRAEQNGSMKMLKKTIAAAAVLAATLGAPASAAPKTDFKIAWTVYVGWMPWGYLESSGIMDKWASKYGISVEIVQHDDYVGSIEGFAAGDFDGVTATNMDALSIASGSGMDSTALIIGDYSNGNDAIILKNGSGLGDLAGRDVKLVKFSASHYLLKRALQAAGMSEDALGSVSHISDADIVDAYAAGSIDATVTWNPLVSTILADPSASVVYDSSDIPGEIIDIMFVSTEVLNDNPELGKALAGAWYEVMAQIDAFDEAALAQMADASGTDIPGFMAQMAQTEMFFDAATAVGFSEGGVLKETMVNMADFLFANGILGEGATSADFIGVTYPDGSTSGDAGNIKFRYDNSYMRMAASGQL
jgi:NitT/TauT family transport system substrate-binding protein